MTAARIRHTPQRTAIREALEGAARPLSLAEILASAQAAVPTLGIATVYRALNQLVAQGWIRAVELPGENDRYEVASRVQHHHHHFRCLDCDRVYDIEGCAGDVARMAPRGFTVERHDITLYGRCASCRSMRQGSAPRSRARGRPQGVAGSRRADEVVRPRPARPGGGRRPT